jgi:hypothetical protein
MNIGCKKPENKKFESNCEHGVGPLLIVAQTFLNAIMIHANLKEDPLSMRRQAERLAGRVSIQKWHQ